MPKSASIELLNHKPIWQPGDTILGQVFLACTVQSEILSASISFTGHAKGYWDDNEQFSFETFCLRQRLFEGPFTLLPGNMVWPFEFVIPTTCKWIDEDKNGAVEQPLPPTFVSAGNSSHVKINYKLKTFIQVGTSFGDRKSTMPIIIFPSRTQEFNQPAFLKIPQSFKVQTLHLDPDIKARSLTFKESLRTAFRRATLPHYSFKIFLELPEVIDPSGAISADIHLEHDLENSTITEIPTVTLLNFSLALKCEIQARRPGNRDSSGKQWLEPRQIYNFYEAISLHEGLEFKDISLQQKFSSDPTRPIVTPTFTTQCVAINYSWKASFTLECATKILYGKISGPCVILAPMTSRSTASTAPALSEEEQLPAYRAGDVAIELES